MYRSSITMALSALVLLPVGAGAEPPPKDADSHAANGSVIAEAKPGHRGDAPVLDRRDTDAENHLAQAELAARAQLSEELQAIWAGKELRRGTTAIYAVDAHTGEPLYAVHEDEALNPASNVKLIASSTALAVLGPEYRYTTRVLGPAPIAVDGVEGVVADDIFLQGSWDPTLYARHMGQLATAMYESGVRRIDGAIHVGLGEDTRITGVRSGGGERDSLAYPRVSFKVRGAKRAGQPPIVEIITGPGMPEGDLLELVVDAKTVARKKKRQPIQLSVDSELVQAEDGGVHWRVTISGRIPTRRRITYRRRAPDGGAFTGQILRRALIGAGIEVTGPVKQRSLAEYLTRDQAQLPVELAIHESAPLSSLLKKVNKRSLNRLADQVIMTTGAARFGGDPTMESGVRAMNEWLQQEVGIAPGEVVLDTGSGLSYQTQLSARQLVDVLRVAGGYAGEQPLSAPFLDSLAIGGVDGTLRRRFRQGPARRDVMAKTGTLTRVIALSGFVRIDEDNAVAFAIVSNGHWHKHRRTVRKQHERLVEAMHRYLSNRNATIAAKN